MSEDVKTEENPETQGEDVKSEDHAEPTVPTRSKHATFEDGRLILDQHPSDEIVAENIKHAQHIADLRMHENEDLIFLQIESKRLDEAFYNLWCGEVNDYFRLLLKNKTRLQNMNKKKKAG